MPVEANISCIMYLSILPIDLHDNVCKHEVLVVGITGDPLPFGVLSQLHVVSLERMRHAVISQRSRLDDQHGGLVYFTQFKFCI